MENYNSKENIEQIKLPIKTKIAAWWIIIYGIASSGYKFFDIYYFHKTHKIPEGAVILGYPPLSDAIIPIILAVLLYSLIGIFLLKKKKMAWYFAIVIFSYFIIGNLFRLFTTISQEGSISLYQLSSFNFLFMLIPVVLLIIDRRNFWKIAT